MSDEAAAIALANLALGGLAKPTESDVQRGIDAAMRDVIRKDARHNPNRLEPPTIVRVANATEVVDAKPLARGWAPEVPIKSPPGQETIRRMVNAELPHGPKSNADRGGGGDDATN